MGGIGAGTAAAVGTGPDALPPTTAASAEGPLRLVVVDVEVDPVGAHGTTTVRATIANEARTRTDAAATVEVRLPARTWAFGRFFPSDCRARDRGSVVTCRIARGLPPEQTAAVEVPVRPAYGVRPGDHLTGGLVTAFDPDRRGYQDAREFEIDVR
ncbi:hypothetical protein GXW82_01640 [Streptacidiphilus sp. 4-A2]|nr:hypothetical protein [Streptacidiphilus sp. 4-A2]